MKKKVLFIVSPFFGGASRMTINIAKLLDVTKFDITFLVYSPKMVDIQNYIPDGFKIQCLNIYNIWDFSTLKLTKILKKNKIDIVFSSFIFINSRIAIAAKIAGNIKVILRNSNHLQNFTPLNKMLMKLSYPLADVIIAQQDEMRNELEKFIPSIKDKLVTLQNIIDTSLIDENIKEDSPFKNDNSTNFIWMGRVTHTKGYDILLEAFCLISKKNDNAHLYLLGRYEEDNYYHSLLKYIEENGLTKKVHFVGLVKNPHKWVKYSDCFVLPSRLEGLPNALLEAMYIGVPVVSTSCIPIINRIVQDGYNGYIVPVEDPKSMAIAMERSLELKNFSMTYKSSSIQDYIKLFN